MKRSASDSPLQDTHHGRLLEGGEDSNLQISESESFRIVAAQWV